jgi:curved DNA-binding protein CbpA
MALNYYRLLGVPPDAGQRRIKSAYRSLAKRFHPDRNSGSETAAELFRQVNHAYKVLSDPQLRKHYDLKLQRENSSEVKTKTSNLDPQQKFNRFVNSLLDAIFGKIEPPAQPTRNNSVQKGKTMAKKKDKPAFNFHYNLAMENEKTPYVRGEDGVFRKAPKENQR